MLLVEFFTTLRKKQPYLFSIIALLSILQLLCTWVKVEVTPVLLYGMYSEKIPLSNEIHKLEFAVDGKPLDSFRINLWHKDILYSAYQNYAAMHSNNDIDIVRTRVESRYHFLTQSPLYPAIRSKIYNTTADIEEFKQWYKQEFARFLHTEVKKINVYDVTYLVDRRTFSITKQPGRLIASL